MKRKVKQIALFILFLFFLMFAWKYSVPRKVDLSDLEGDVSSGVYLESLSGIPENRKLMPPPNMGRRIVKPARLLALYDSAEGVSAKENHIRDWAEQPLETLGLSVDYYDISKGLPDEEMMMKYRGIITWFRDSQMREASIYCQWLARQVKFKGRKVIILGNFGAFQEADSGKWLGLDEVNNVFHALGLDYKASYTSEPKFLRVDYKDADMIEYEHPLSLKETKSYFLFESILPENKDYLVVRRTDVPESDSSLVISTPYGGMALSNYIYYVDPKSFQVKMRLNFLRFFKESLWDERQEGSHHQKVLVLWDKGDEFSLQYLYNIGWALYYAKIEYETLELEDTSNLLLPDMREYSSVLLALNRVWKIENKATISGLKRYVQEGGRLISLYQHYNEDLADVFGIRVYGGEYKQQVLGMKFLQPLFPGAEGLEFPGLEIENSCLNLMLEDSVDILAVSSEKIEGDPKEVPLLWEYKYGQGKTLNWNADCLWEKSYRGFIVQSILRTQPVGIASIANIEIVFIDDVPLPIWDKIIKSIGEGEYITDKDFYLDVWWPALLELAKKYKINYTTAAVFNYNGKVNAPYDNSQFHNSKESASLRLGRIIMEEDFEMGLHGYNHQSLLLEPTYPVSRGWRTKENMVLALKAGKEEWERVFSCSPFTCVAPNNIISAEGEAALHEVFPSIKVLSTIYAGDETETSKEFTVDPLNSNFFNIPRMSSEHFRTPGMMKEMLNGMGSFGVWTHFIHPDDVYDKERSHGKSWKEMYFALDEMFSFMRRTYPWLRNMSAKDAYYEFLRYESHDAHYIIGDEGIEIESSSGSRYPSFLIVRVNDGRTIGDMVDCKIVYEYPEFKYYLLEVNAPRAFVSITSDDVDVKDGEQDNSKEEENVEKE